MVRVRIRAQVKEFLETLAPEPRRRLKFGLKTLAKERGDRLALREKLSGYYRLRIGSYRVIYRYLPGGILECVFAEQRSLVYQIFEREVMERLRREDDERRFTVEEEAPAPYGVRPRRQKKPRQAKPSKRTAARRKVKPD
jgi:mRNA interferase RelE/StbE